MEGPPSKIRKKEGSATKDESRKVHPLPQDVHEPQPLATPEANTRQGWLKLQLPHSTLSWQFC